MLFALTAVNAAVMSGRRQRVLGVWLMGCSVMVGGAVLIGGITRLTESGLSMTQWHPIRGMKPPRTEREWEEEFEKYKQYPEYKVWVLFTAVAHTLIHPSPISFSPSPLCQCTPRPDARWLQEDIPLGILPSDVGS